jgi:hypothetical protein
MDSDCEFYGLPDRQPTARTRQRRHRMPLATIADLASFLKQDVDNSTANLALAAASDALRDGR